MIHAPFRKIFYAASIGSVVLVELLAWAWPVWPVRLLYLLVIPFVVVGLSDILQTRQAIRRNFPIVGRGRYLLESIRPEIYQYFIESDINGRPFDRVTRSNVYQRAKRELNSYPFGTRMNVYEEGYEWINHSLHAFLPEPPYPRIIVGGQDCEQPYVSSYLNISAMSYGSLSTNAILALNSGAKEGGFAHNTGEGGVSPYHLEPGGDLIWQIGTGYFGCRDEQGNFNPEAFAERAGLDNVKMIEIKLSQGAKPGHGGILPKQKITPEIARIRLIPQDEDAISPPSHREFNTPIGLLQFVDRLRKLSGGKPVGFKLCVGNPHEFLGICKAMLETKIVPDFITVDGSEGGTGAAPVEFSNAMGMPLHDGLVFVHNALMGIDMRQKIRIVAAGKITDGFDMVKTIAMGADMCNSARGMMFALGCIQALQCHSNHCPTGIATQDPELVAGLDVQDKSRRVANYHAGTIAMFMEIIGAAGLHDPSELRPYHIMRREETSTIKRLDEIYEYIPRGGFLDGGVSESYRTAWEVASSETFDPRFKTRQQWVR